MNLPLYCISLASHFLTLGGSSLAQQRTLRHTALPTHRSLNACNRRKRSLEEKKKDVNYPNQKGNISDIWICKAKASSHIVVSSQQALNSELHAIFSAGPLGWFVVTLSPSTLHIVGLQLPKERKLWLTSGYVGQARSAS